MLKEMIFMYIPDKQYTPNASDLNELEEEKLREEEMEKADMLRKVCTDLDVEPSDALFVGDSYVDALAAEEVGMDFAAALYGWGFRSKADAEKYHCKAYLNKAGEIGYKLSAIE